MSAMQVDAAELLHLLESQDLTVVAEIESLIKDNLQSSREAWLLNGLVDSYMVSQSQRCMQILATIQEPHDKHLMDRIVEHIKGSGTYRLQALTLFAYIVRRQPGWLYQVAHHSLMATILKCLKTDSDVPVLMCGVLIIASIVPIIPVAITRHLHDIFEAFSRLVAFNLRKPGNVPDVYLIHLQVGVYALFHRLYGMYPCNFLTYLRATYSKPENKQIFEDLVKPMLERVRMHPLLVTASKDKELAMERWRHKEVHDIMVDCAKMSLDPIEGWSEESLGPVLSQTPRIPPVGPDMGLSPPPTKKNRPPPLLPVTEAALTEPLPPTLAAQDPLWSPSSVCGLSTPPPLTPVSAAVTPSLPEVPPFTGGVITPLPCLTSHVDSPLPHDETERRRVAMLNTHLAVQVQANTDGPFPSVPPSPLKPDFTSEPPFHVHPMKAIRKINFDNPPADVVDGLRGQGSGVGGQDEVVTPAEEAVEDVASAVASRTPMIATRGAAKPVSQFEDEIPDSLLREKPHVPASSSVPSVSQLPQFIDSLDVVSPTEDKSEEEDKEVSELTQEGPDDDSTSESSMGVPSHIPPNVQMTAESVAAFMKQVNRIRFNSMNVTSQEKTVKERPYSRSNSCPNLKDKAAEIDEATEDHPHEDDVSHDVTDHVTPAVRHDVTTDVTSDDVTMTTTTKVTTTIQTQTSIVSTTSVCSSDGQSIVTSQQKEAIPAVTSRPETEGERFYRYLMGILLPPPLRCEMCEAREAKEVTEKSEVSGKGATAQPPVIAKRTHTLAYPRGPPPIPSPGAVPIYTTMSPPEMLDRHILLGGDVHADELSRIPLTSQANVSWTHFGGVPPADEVNILGGQLLLLHNQLMFERHKSELHAKRNRRLLGRTVKTMALEEQYAAMQDQLRLQENEIQSLSESLRHQQQAAGELRAANDKHVCDRQVLQKSHAEEVENLRLSKEVLQSELRAQKEESDRLCKELQRERSRMFCVEQELESVKTKVNQTDELQDQVKRLNKELLLMGELQQKYQQRLVAVSNSHNAKPETQFILDSYKAELAAVKLCLDQKNTLLESTRARVSEAEEHCKQKELMLAEDKKLIEQLRLQHKGEIQALEEKYRAQKKIQLGLHSQILELYGKIPEPSQPGPAQDESGEAQSLETPQPSLTSFVKSSPQVERPSVPLGGGTGLNSPPPPPPPPGSDTTTTATTSIATTSPKTEHKESPPTGITLHSGSAFKSYQEQKLAESQPEKNA